MTFGETVTRIPLRRPETAIHAIRIHSADISRMSDITIATVSMAELNVAVLPVKLHIWFMVLHGDHGEQKLYRQDSKEVTLYGPVATI